MGNAGFISSTINRMRNYPFPILHLQTKGTTGRPSVNPKQLEHGLRMIRAGVPVRYHNGKGIIMF